MSISRVCAVFGLLALAAGPAVAADIIEPIEPEPVPVVVASGWYLRGDVGYVFKEKSRGEWDFWNQGLRDHHGNFVKDPKTGKVLARGFDDAYRFDEIKLKDAVSVGLGAGYRFNEFVRADATLDFWRPDVKTRTECPLMIKSDKAHSLPFPSDCSYNGKSDVDIWTAMANAYIDLPFFGSAVVPYVGAGFGAAYLDYKSLDFKENCPACKPSYKRYENTSEGEDDWRFAGALMAGATIDLTGNLKLDAGYKYTRISGGDAFGYDDEDRKAEAEGTQVRDNGFDVHAVRAGLRYEFF